MTNASGVLSEDGYWTITLDEHLALHNREHTWRHDWILATIKAIDARSKKPNGTCNACACRVIFPDNVRCRGGGRIGFATDHPEYDGKEGSVVVVSYQSGGQVLRFESGAWRVVAMQPPRTQ